ncbi:High-affinity glucose transporter [Lachnellula hyalina]|uniref:High-affinity glucose transporter n=1 Tax=Lachnellula hyalina TaxID=1316788 RepID=A0A8H8R066_9HELO|nr:High-affinity glucose transporter [Lachnellula hyalina]TVY26083.1 High-affinity glucose transporter [Lachnellula hyalina]
MTEVSDTKMQLPSEKDKSSFEATGASESQSVDIPRHTSFVNVVVIATACLGGFLYGFSANTISGTLAQTTFIAKFLTGSNATQITDGLFGGFLGGAMVGSLVQAPVANKFGRKIANACASIIVLVSAALQAGSVSIEMFLTARVLCGIGAGMVLANTPVYMSEVSPPHNRGLLVGLQGVGIVSAYIVAAICALAFSFVKSAIQWRLNFIVLAVIACIHLGSLYFLPESPRWLMEKGRDEEAKKVLEYLHNTESDPDATFAQAEAVQIKAQVETEKLLPKGFIYIFSTPHLRKRAFCSILLWIMGQGTGITAIANLVPTFMAGLGFGTTLQLGLGVVWSVCALIGCGFNVVLLDLVGGFGSAAILSVMAALVKYYLGSTNQAGTNALVALYFIFGAFFTSTVECTSYVYGSEIWPTHLRSEGSTLAYASFFGNAIAYSAPVSVALKNIGWEFYMILVSVTVVSAIGIAFYFPETMGLSLEEINHKFGDAVEVELKDAFVTETHGAVLVNSVESSKPE